MHLKYRLLKSAVAYIYMLILKFNVNVEANIVDLDQAASVRAARSVSPMFNQMVRVYTM